MIPWWAIIIGIVVIVIVISTMRGWVIARRCRRMTKRENNELPTNQDEDTESGDAGS
ncbi:MAG: hypothetical protein ABSF47_03865 [Minisyncoccia bacterium]|jgi:Flp pilus assembly protein TadB